MKVLIVDDSLVFRSQIKRAIEEVSIVEHVDLASNGKLAIQKMGFTKYDLVILDVEMPELDGIATLKEMKAKHFSGRVIMFSSSTARAAEATLQALSLGASDFITKPSNVANFDAAFEAIKNDLIPKAFELAPDQEKKPALRQASGSDLAARGGDSIVFPTIFEPSSTWHKADLNIIKPKIIVVGSSTGGPVALRDFLAHVKPPLPVPIVIVQHMPPIFTTTLAQNIARQTGVDCKEAVDGEILESDRIYIAPGDYHLHLFQHESWIRVRLDQAEKRNSVRPAVDYLFESAAKIYGRHVLGWVLTGMGQDGLMGAKAIKDQGGCLNIQDKESSVVWGMPGTIFQHDCYDYVLPIKECASTLEKILARLK